MFLIQVDRAGLFSKVSRWVTRPTRTIWHGKSTVMRPSKSTSSCSANCLYVPIIPFVFVWFVSLITPNQLKISSTKRTTWTASGSQWSSRWTREVLVGVTSITSSLTCSSSSKQVLYISCDDNIHFFFFKNCREGIGGIINFLSKSLKKDRSTRLPWRQEIVMALPRLVRRSNFTHLDLVNYRFPLLCFFFEFLPPFFN